MVNSLFKISITLVLVALFLGALPPSRELTVFAVEDPLSVSWESQPLFSHKNLAPGDTVTKKLIITNSSGTTQYAAYLGAIETLLEQGTDNGYLPDKLLVAVKDEDGNVLLANTVLAELIEKSKESSCANVTQMREECSSGLNFILEPGQTKPLFVELSFDRSATNEYQDAQIGFDVAAGFSEVGTVLGTSTGPDGLLGIAVGANLIYSVMGSLAALSTGLWLRRRSSSVSPSNKEDKEVS